MTATSTTAPASQTLSRGIRMLEILAEANGPMTIAELAEDLGVHRSIAYRILRTLESHRLVTRDESGRVHGAPGLAVLASSVQRDLQSAALPELTLLANELKMCAFIAVWDQPDCTTLVTVEPRHVHAAVVQRPGSRHPFGHGAPGIAMQSTLTEEQWAALNHETPYRKIASEARALGYATSIDEVIPGLSSVAAPVTVPGQLPAAVAVVYSTGSRQNEVAAIGERLKAAARAIEAELG
ncbi:MULTISPECIES: IclR family transcriptional regulator [Paeniglutamicibacter]|uniref:DNA-binding IclR family transcriptional regulator n=2 Tax=Paeniglutamicibacter TaxID=1742990 RepID=A0ABU2BNL5_9MICC|nr:MULTISPECIES: helix-turn-helix domain-containing protein [Paeniglutamicibacter]MCV9993989.1 helix-turn-helix domain-containing protein [Paeniglutamicibacter sp. ZC-3]MDR7360245.1 DNA-binding IclR family transcriptional regulator [Paeniglutamicibacter sulfureus]